MISVVQLPLRPLLSCLLPHLRLSSIPRFIPLSLLMPRISGEDPGEPGGENGPTIVIPDINHPDDDGQDGSSFRPPKRKDREPGSLHPLTVGVKKSQRDGALGVYTVYAVFSAHQLIAALIKLSGRGRGKGFQRTTKYRILLVLTTLALLISNTLGVAYIKLDREMTPQIIESQTPEAADNINFLLTFQDLFTKIWAIQAVSDLFAKVAQWLVSISASALVFDYLAYTAQGSNEAFTSFKQRWDGLKQGYTWYNWFAPTLAILGVIQLVFSIVAIQNGDAFLPDGKALLEITRKVVAFVFMICFGILNLSLCKLWEIFTEHHKVLVPELKDRGTTYAMLNLLLLALFFFVDACLIASDSDQSKVKLAEITVVGGLTCCLVWCLLWEQQAIPTAEKAHISRWSPVIFWLIGTSQHSI